MKIHLNNPHPPPIWEFEDKMVQKTPIIAPIIVEIAEKTHTSMMIVKNYPHLGPPPPYLHFVVKFGYILTQKHAKTILKHPH